MIYFSIVIILSVATTTVCYWLAVAVPVVVAVVAVAAVVFIVCYNC